MKKQKSCLADDVIQIILSKLPVKTLMRCKCVSKEWKSLINTTHFISSHLHHSSANKLSIIQGIDLVSRLPKLLLLRDGSLVEDLKLPFSRDKIGKIDDIRTRMVVGSCNGLVCFNLSENYTTIMLWNPATRKARYLPEPKLMFTEEEFPYQLSFGFDHVNNDYKLVRVTQMSSFKLGVQIFKQSSNYWRQGKAIVSGYRMICSDPVIVNGVLYLLAEHDTKNGLNNCILRFNLCCEEFQEVLDLPCKSKRIMFSKWKESFAVVEPKNLDYNFWIKNDGLPGWTKLFKISGCFDGEKKSYFVGTCKDQLLFSNYYDKIAHNWELRLVAVVRELRAVLEALLRQRGGQLEACEYDWKLTLLDATYHGDYINNHRIIKRHGTMDRYLDTFDHTESLVPVNPPS